MRTLCSVVFAVVFLQMSSSVQAGVITNGDFSGGNSGFANDYSFVAAPGTSASPGTYAIRTNPQNYNPGLESFGDHTTGFGNMLLLDGVGSSTAWQQTLSVNANTTYSFSAWATPTSLPFPAILRFTANGLPLGSDFSLTPNPGVWQNFSATWFSGAATSLTLRVVDLNPITAAPGNDFALDDISLTSAAVPEPSSMTLLIVCTFGVFAGRSRKAALDHPRLC